MDATQLTTRRASRGARRRVRGARCATATRSSSPCTCCWRCSRRTTPGCRSAARRRSGLTAPRSCATTPRRRSPACRRASGSSVSAPLESRARWQRVLAAAVDRGHPAMGDEYVSTEHLLVGARAGRRSRGRAADATAASTEAAVLEAFDAGPRRRAVTSADPEGTYQALEKYGVDLTARGPRGQARPGHRPGQRDPPGRAGAVPAHEEQPGAHRRARRRQDRRRRGPRPAHRRRRRAGVAAQQAAGRRSTSARWSPARSTAASSRSG